LLDTINPPAFVILFADFEYRKFCGHDPSRRAAWYHVIFGKVGDALLSQEILIEIYQAVDFGGGGVDHRNDGVGEYRLGPV
jgi:hypothetical protein